MTYEEKSPIRAVSFDLVFRKGRRLLFYPRLHSRVQQCRTRKSKEKVQNLERKLDASYEKKDEISRPSNLLRCCCYC